MNYDAPERQRIGWALSPHRDSFAVFAGNTDEFLATLNAFVPALFDQGREDDRARIGDASRRHLHNWLASTMMLRDATRAFLNAHSTTLGAEFNTEYASRTKATFELSPLAQFVQGLRHYGLHCRLPTTVAQLQMRSTDSGSVTDCGIRLHRASLLAFSGWTRPARDFLTVAPPLIDLATLVRSYANLVEEFYSWFYEDLGRRFPMDDEFIAATENPGNVLRELPPALLLDLDDESERDDWGG